MKEKHIREMRAFNRFYTGIIGLLDKYILNSSYSLPEVRILYELYYNESLTATDIISLLNIDKGYLSRILRHFEKKKLVSKNRSSDDGRAALLFLTNAGKKEFETLNEASNKQISVMLEALTEEDCDRLTQLMSEIKTILSKVN